MQLFTVISALSLCLSLNVPYVCGLLSSWGEVEARLRV